MSAFNIMCLTPLTVHVVCNELVVKGVRVRRWGSKFKSHHQHLYIPSCEWEVPSCGLDEFMQCIWLLICWNSPFKNSHVAYSHYPYKMSHLHNFPCPIEYSHYQSRDMCKIPTLSTFPSKPYEPRDMKGILGNFPIGTQVKVPCVIVLAHSLDILCIDMSHPIVPKKKISVTCTWNGKSPW